MTDAWVQKLSDFIGTAVVRDFRANYCRPYREETPHLNALAAKKCGETSLRMVGLNVGGVEDKGKIPQFVSVTPIAYEISFPENESNDLVFDQARTTPQTLISDRQGTLLARVVCFSAAIQNEPDTAVERAVAQD